MLQKLQNKWGVKGWQFVLILTTFACGGSLCGIVGRNLLQLFFIEKNIFYYLIYIPTITLLWPVCVLLVSIPLGQFSFFKNYLQRVFNKIFTKKSSQ